MDELSRSNEQLRPRVPPALRRRRRSPLAGLALAVVVLALLLVVFKGLGDATMFFRNADEAVAQREQLGDRRFRIQGLVDGGSITPTPMGVDFVISYNGVDVTISHQGDPPDLFQPLIPVVLEGRWVAAGDPEIQPPAAELLPEDGWFFASDVFFVKHDEVYLEEHPERTGDYDDGESSGVAGEPGDGSAR